MIYLSILWHMHQPSYVFNGEINTIIPVFRTLFNYYPMAVLTEKYPDIKINFNFTPVLLDQIQGITSAKYYDNFLSILVDDTNDEEKILTFASEIPGRILEKQYTLKILLDKVKTNTFSVQDISDIKVHLHLACFHPFIIDEELKQLVKKSRYFDKKEKELLYNKEKNILKETINKYKNLMKTGQCEIITSPMTHPIMPLLYNTNIAKQTKTSLPIPENLFSYPEDAEEQLIRGINIFKTTFEKCPDGIWPPEGSLSNEILDLFAKHNIKWTATDQQLLSETLSRPLFQKEHYNIWDFREKIFIFFRDHHLSDMIGFSYQHMEEKEAAVNFIEHIHKSSDKTKNQLITIILDGENPWDYYPSFGFYFLPTLYTMLSESSDIKTITFSEALKLDIKHEKLERIVPGSWMGVNFDNWIGKQPANTAWKILQQVRKLSEEKINSLDDTKKEKLKEYIMLAESSDWFWWYSIPADKKIKRKFDAYFRNNIRKIYEILDVKAPEFLNFPVENYDIEEFFPYIKPSIDGKITHFYEWYNAVEIDAADLWTTFKPVEIPIKKIFYGYDDENVYIRIDTLEKQNIEIEITFHNSVKQKFYIKNDLSSSLPISFVYGDIIEIKIPKKEILLEGEKTIFFNISIRDREGHEIVLPTGDYFKITFLSEEENWII